MGSRNRGYPLCGPAQAQPRCRKCGGWLQDGPFQRVEARKGLPRLDGRLGRPTRGKCFQVLDGDAPTRISRYCSLRCERHLGTTIFRLAGEFDLACDERFQEELGRWLDSEVTTFLLDLRGLEFIDSTGLRMLVQIDTKARQDGFDFALLCGDGQVRRVLRETGLDGMLPLVDPAGAVPATDSPL
jgi:anti-sigma B factor antagonist